MNKLRTIEIRAFALQKSLPSLEGALVAVSYNTLLTEENN